MSLIRFVLTATVFTFLNQAAHAGEVRFTGPSMDDARNVITGSSVDRMISSVRKLVNSGDRNITVILNSDGGNVWQAKRGYDYLRSVGANTLVTGSCGSACTILFAGGRSRTASSNARFMFHGVTVEKNKSDRSDEEVARRAANMWLSVVRSVDGSLAADLQRKGGLLGNPGREYWYRGSKLRETGYVNN